MKTISMLELRSQGRAVVRRLARGEQLALTYRGRKVATLQPEPALRERQIPADDPARAFHQYAEPLGTLTNKEIDQILYGHPK